MSEVLTHGGLFEGYGGLGEAVNAIFGSRTTWYAESEAAPSRVLAHHYPGVPNLGDVTTVDWTAVEPVDIISGGYPCQPFSQAGRRMGTEDERHLWPYVADAIAVIRPTFVAFENVRGHLSLGFGEVVRDLHQLGYDVEWILVKASDLGACHQRARLFILGVNRERRVRSRLDRWGGLHRHPGVGGFASGAPQGQHDGQGAPCAPCAAEAVWRQGGAGQAGHRDEPRIPYVGPHWGVGGVRHQAAASPVPGQAGGCGCGAGVRRDADRLADAPEPWALLDGRDAGECGDAEAPNPGGESARPGPRTARAAGCDTARGLSLGLVVGAGGRPVRGRGVHGAPADVGFDDRGTPVRSAGAGGRSGGQVLAYARGIGGHEAIEHDGRGAQVADGSGVPHERDRHALRAGPDRALTLLPTPTSSDTNGAGAHGTGGADLRTTVALLPTPRATDGAKGGPNQRGSSGDLMLPSAVVQLLPTPRTENNENRQAEGYGGIRGNFHGLITGQVSWGEYAAAIARHERLIGRPAPEPTELGPKGNPRLSARFVEWMQCLPEGWVTDRDVTRNEALKMLGGGVVPVQAEHALRLMLTRMEET